MYEEYAKIRDSKGLKDSDVSKLTGISQGTLSDWKRGRYNLRYEKLKKIAELLEVPVEAFDGIHQNVQSDGYYLNQETVRIAQKIFDDPYLRVLLDAAEDSRPEHLQMAADILRRLKQTNNNEL